MDYKEQVALIRGLAYEWNKCSHITKIGGMKLEEFLLLTATAITDLLARAAAEEARAEKAERERDAAIQDISGICYLCANAKPYFALSRTVMTCEHKKYCGTKSPGYEHFKWRGNKEE